METEHAISRFILANRVGLYCIPGIMGFPYAQYTHQVRRNQSIQVNPYK